MSGQINELCDRIPIELLKSTIPHYGLDYYWLVILLDVEN